MSVLVCGVIFEWMFLRLGCQLFFLLQRQCMGVLLVRLVMVVYSGQLGVGISILLFLFSRVCMVIVMSLEMLLLRYMLFGLNCGKFLICLQWFMMVWCVEMMFLLLLQLCVVGSVVSMLCMIWWGVLNLKIVGLFVFSLRILCFFVFNCVVLMRVFLWILYRMFLSFDDWLKLCIGVID